MNSLDQQISDAFGLLGLLLVFVIGYFSALLPQAEELIDRRASDVKEDRRALRSRLHSYRKLTIGLLTMIALVSVVLSSLTRQVLVHWSFRGPFQTLRAGLLLIDIFLVAMFVVGARLSWRLSKRADAIRELGI